MASGGRSTTLFKDVGPVDGPTSRTLVAQSAFSQLVRRENGCRSWGMGGRCLCSQHTVHFSKY